MPFIIGLLPLFGLGVFVDQRTEWALISISLIVGLSSLLPAYLGKHKRTRPLFLFMTGLVLIFIARVSFENTLRAEIHLWFLEPCSSPGLIFLIVDFAERVRFALTTARSSSVSFVGLRVYGLATYPPITTTQLLSPTFH